MSQRQLSPNPVGRPTKFTPEARAKLLHHIGLGDPLETACQLAGFTYDAFRDWMVAGQRGDERFVQFFQDVYTARAQAEAKIAAGWRDHFGSDWKASRDYLARQWPEHWADQSKRTVTIEGSQPIQINVLSITDVDGLAGLLGAGELVDVDPVEDDPNDDP